jgi:hypothetical protein
LSSSIISLRSALFAIVSALVVAVPARAATTAASSFATGSVCQLSIPTTDTRFRPKATGARNESTTTSSFVICPLRSIPATNSDMFTSVSISIYSIDGASHSVSCTAVSGSNGRGVLYSTKNVDVSAEDGAIGATAAWTAADFDGTDGDPITGSIGFSVTCSLPAQTAINSLEGSFEYEIGS